MDIGRLKNNTKFSAEEFCPEFAEPNITLSLKEAPEFNLRIWEGHVDEIFDPPIFTDKDWIGFTRDCQEFIGAWGDKTEMDNIDEYIWDMLRYKDKKFDWKETPEVFNLIIDFLTYAKQTGQTIVMEKDY